MSPHSNHNSSPIPVVSPVTELPLERLRCWPENPRTISPERLEQLKQALTADPEMLQARPLLALPDGTVIAGNQRLRVALGLGWKTIPVVTVALEPERARLWALRDNNPYGDWTSPRSPSCWPSWPRAASSSPWPASPTASSSAC